MFKKILATLVVTLALNNFVLADVFSNPSTAEAISDELPAFAQISCGFVQKKFPSNSNVSLVSRGNFEYSKDKGVSFKTTFPANLTTEYANPYSKEVNEIITAIASSDFSNIEKSYDLFFEYTGNSWNLGLRPKKDSPVNSQIMNITASGKEIIDLITVNTKTSGKIMISFESLGIRDFRDDEGAKY